MPEDISIIGFDHLRGFLHYLQPLSSIAGIQTAEPAKRSVALLIRRIQKPDEALITEILPVVMHEEKSTITEHFIPAGNEPSIRTRADIGRLPLERV